MRIFLPTQYPTLDNLLFNALKHACDGPEPRIEIGSRAADGEVRLFVWDIGPGIDPQQHENLFSRFQQLDATRAGSGVGPAIVRRIMEVHRGRAWVESNLGEGAYANRPRQQLILLDLKLPRMDGHQVQRILKGDDHFHAIPILVLTTSDADNDVHQACRLHDNSYLVKPVNFGEFRQLIRAVLSYWGVCNLTREERRWNCG